MADTPNLTRRAVLKAGAVVAATTVTSTRLSAFTLPADGPRALTRDQYAMLDELTEILIPADEHSGGARAAGVAAYIDCDAGRRGRRDSEGVVRVGAGARRGPGAATSRPRVYGAVAGRARRRSSRRWPKERPNPKTDEARFFVALKRRTVRGYYTSRLGIHDEMNYKGNTMQEEYSGIDVSPPR